uniref:uncharacterized protein LOC118547320 n=1 Tax=Halichoerus grypus TaxID=9711 RepID=UPI001659A34C|nr:uncharacterized protein LOC118547320 [Halichoerus grypus]
MGAVSSVPRDRVHGWFYPPLTTPLFYHLRGAACADHGPTWALKAPRACAARSSGIWQHHFPSAPSVGQVLASTPGSALPLRSQHTLPPTLSAGSLCRGSSSRSLSDAVCWVPLSWVFLPVSLRRCLPGPSVVGLPPSVSPTLSAGSLCHGSSSRSLSDAVCRVRLSWVFNPVSLRRRLPGPSVVGLPTGLSPTQSAGSVCRGSSSRSLSDAVCRVPLSWVFNLVSLRRRLPGPSVMGLHPGLSPTLSAGSVCRGASSWCLSDAVCRVPLSWVFIPVSVCHCKSTNRPILRPVFPSDERWCTQLYPQMTPRVFMLCGRRRIGVHWAVSPPGHSCP